MADSIGVKIMLDGEKQFRQALADINAGLKMNKSEMAMVTAEFGKNATGADALNAKQKALASTISTQTNKVALLKNALAESTAKYGENSAQTVKLQTDYNNARAELTKMNNELKSSESAMDSAEKESRSLADAITGIASAAGISLPPALQGMVNKLGGINANVAAFVGVAAGAVTALGKMTISTAKTADNILTMSSTTGLSTDALQEFEYASELVDVSLDTLTGSMTKMIRSMNSARDGTKTAKEAYEKLHIQIKNGDGTLRDANEVFYETIDALGKVKNETERDAISMQIFGKSARDLNPLIEAGSGRLRELAEEAHNMGYVMSEETLGKFGLLDDAMQRMSKQTEALKNSLALALLPILTALFTAISQIPVPVLQTLIILGTVILTITMVVKAIKSMTDTGMTIAKFFSGITSPAARTTAMIMGAVIAFLALATVIAVIIGRGNELQHTMDSIGNSASQLRGQVNDVQSSIPRHAAGTLSARRGLALVGERGPELVAFGGGERVYPAHQTKAMLSGGATTENYYITIDAKNVREFNDIVEMAKNARQERRRRI